MSDIGTDDQTLRLERRIAAPPDRVFAHFAEPELFVKWWGPEGFGIPAHAIDVRPGGRWRTTMRSPEGSTHVVSGVYRAVEPPRKLVFTWGWHDSASDARGHESEVTITFEPAPGGTRLVIVHQALEGKASADQHAHGWESTLNCLEQVIAAGK